MYIFWFWWKGSCKRSICVFGCEESGDLKDVKLVLSC